MRNSNTHTEALLKGHRTCRPPPHAVTLKPLNQLSHPGRRVTLGTPPPTTWPLHIIHADTRKMKLKGRSLIPLSDFSSLVWIPNIQTVTTSALLRGLPVPFVEPNRPYSSVSFTHQPNLRLIDRLHIVTMQSRKGRPGPETRGA